MQRFIFLDTETTGLSPTTGHRVIEIGAIEMVNRRLTGKTFHTYLDPERDIDPGAERVHGLSRAFLTGKPLFGAVLDAFVAFVNQATLIIHNAPFDVGFLDAEFARVDKQASIAGYCSVIDTLDLARKQHPGAKNNLDALCKRYGVDNKHRQFHGALLDSALLSDVYLAMTQGQEGFLFQGNTEKKAAPKTAEAKIPFTANRDDLAKHQAYLKRLEAESGKVAEWD